MASSSVGVRRLSCRVSALPCRWRSASQLQGPGPSASRNPAQAVATASRSFNHSSHQLGAVSTNKRGSGLIKPAGARDSRLGASGTHGYILPQASRALGTGQRQQQQQPPPAQTTAGADEDVHRDLTTGFNDGPLILDENSRQVDWSRSFHGLSDAPFSPETTEMLLRPLPYDDIEIKPDGIVYLPEIKYRRILNKAFGPGAWGLAPRGETIVTEKSVTREYGMVAHGRLVSIARGEQAYFDPEGIATATEGCKSNALMRCCKDLGIASELWDPRFIKRYMAQHAQEVIVEHATTGRRKRIYVRKGDDVKYPYKEVTTKPTQSYRPVSSSTGQSPSHRPASASSGKSQSYRPVSTSTSQSSQTRTSK